MSTAPLALPTPAGARSAAPRADPLPSERQLMRLLAFAALGLYGVLRWGTMLAPQPSSRLLGLLGLALLVAASGGALYRRNRILAAGGAVAAALAVLPLAGVPVSWVLHIRVAVTADAVGAGLSALPRVLVPYNGINEWVRVVTLLGAGVLLLDAAVMLAFTPRSLGELRRAGAAFPLVALAVVPSTIARPQLPYLHGLILLVLLSAFIWGERLRRREVASAFALVGTAGACGMLAAPTLDRHSAWLNYQALTRSLSPGHVETFDFSQRYGPLHWPRTGRAVLEVKAQHPDYWKAENLDVFDGREWVAGAVQPASPLSAVDPSAIARWRQTLQVTIRAMRSSDVIASGAASSPTHLVGPVLRGTSPGTWTTATELAPGDSYAVSTYAPQPSPRELAAVRAASGSGYMPPPGYRAITLPPASGPRPTGSAASAPLPVVFARFGSRVAVRSGPELTAGQLVAAVETSPYGRAFALARQLERHAATPYAYVSSVERYLTQGYSYSESPPARAFPLESFLFKDKLGYCQQFSGAMALLLRLGGIPARVAAGFTTGQYDNASHRWIVSDLDAHAWVEAWFAHYGWVSFDPTPAAAPARGGHVALPALRGGTRAPANPHPLRRPERAPAPAPVSRPTHGSSSSTWPIVTALVVLLAMLGLALSRRPRPLQPTADQLVAELERALRRCGRPITGGLTLAALEHRFHSSAEAAGYLRAVRLLRFGGTSEPPTRTQRRALRAQLGHGLGVLGRVRALWALPPQLGLVALSRSDRSARGLDSK